LLDSTGPWVPYSFEDCATLFVSPRCPECGRFVVLGEITIEGWRPVVDFGETLCSKHGVVKPHYWI
jgi:hypothetical protein